MKPTKTIRETIMQLIEVRKQVSEAIDVLQDMDAKACDWTREEIERLSAVPHDERVKSRLAGTDPLASGTRADGSTTSPYGAGNGPV